MRRNLVPSRGTPCRGFQWGFLSQLGTGLVPSISGTVQQATGQGVPPDSHLQNPSSIPGCLDVRNMFRGPYCPAQPTCEGTQEPPWVERLPFCGRKQGSVAQRSLVVSLANLTVISHYETHPDIGDSVPSIRNRPGLVSGIDPRFGKSPLAIGQYNIPSSQLWKFCLRDKIPQSEIFRGFGGGGAATQPQPCTRTSDLR